jgi:hypothetical protein
LGGGFNLIQNDPPGYAHLLWRKGYKTISSPEFNSGSQATKAEEYNISYSEQKRR